MWPRHAYSAIDVLFIDLDAIRSLCETSFLSFFPVKRTLLFFFFFFVNGQLMSLSFFFRDMLFLFDEILFIEKRSPSLYDENNAA